MGICTDILKMCNPKDRAVTVLPGHHAWYWALMSMTKLEAVYNQTALLLDVLHAI